ncbi:hypothetical protein AAVH_05025 [Aphelenchoides avenae]|nr:hypothetical protein AAVH_05025 [Aphelenchus avenae]
MSTDVRALRPHFDYGFTTVFAGLELLLTAPVAYAALYAADSTPFGWQSVRCWIQALTALAVLLNLATCNCACVYRIARRTETAIAFAFVVLWIDSDLKDSHRIHDVLLRFEVVAFLDYVGVIWTDTSRATLTFVTATIAGRELLNAVYWLSLLDAESKATEERNAELRDVKVNA